VKFRVRPVARLHGEAEVPGDKSVSHRAALLGALAEGASEVQGYLEAEDCLRTITAVQALGAEVTRKGPGHYRIAGGGLRGFSEPGDVIDCGNSGTTARLLAGVLGTQPFWTMLTGDASLRRRPMRRIAEPLRAMGATIVGRADGTLLPLAIRGTGLAKAVQYATPVASAQVKSAILLAGHRDRAGPLARPLRAHAAPVRGPRGEPGPDGDADAGPAAGGVGRGARRHLLGRVPAGGRSDRG
jgi:3-phosphoshikimate 1-carboxyvinyltransferase